MDRYRETAFYVTGWHAFLGAFTALIAIVLDDPDFATALLIAANVAIVFALLLVARTNGLTLQRVTRGLFWQALPPKERPAGRIGIEMAHRALAETWLRFAKGAAAVAVALSILAYLSHDVGRSASASALSGPAAQQSDDNLPSAYDPGRFVPTN
jgi:hypothetical protein